MSLLSGLENFGLGKYKDEKILKKDINEEKEKSVMVEKVEVKETDCIIDKRYTCAVCDCKFTSKTVRAGKIKLISKDTDMRPTYDVLDPTKYDVIICDKCGYAALTRYFGKLTTYQMKTIRHEIGSSFSGIDNSMETISYKDALIRYKLALVCAIVKNAKNSERGYICLKMSWILRGMRMELEPEKKSEIADYYKQELECIENAYNAFTDALSKESLPIAGMDENTLKYLLADLARRLKRFDEAAKLISSVIVSHGATDRLKDQAINLRDQIKVEMRSAAFTGEKAATEDGK